MHNWWIKMPTHHREGPVLLQSNAFGLKNAGATYQCLMNKMFTKQLGKIIKVYIDDMMIKSREADQHLRDIDECFQVLQYYKMWLNPRKCAFGVSFGQFLGHIVTKHSIEANPT